MWARVRRRRRLDSKTCIHSSKPPIGESLNAFDAETAAFAPTEHKEHTKHEAKKHDLPVVQQGRA